MWRRPAQRTPNAVNIYAHAEESAGMWRRPVVPARVAHDADALGLEVVGEEEPSMPRLPHVLDGRIVHHGDVGEVVGHAQRS